MQSILEFAIIPDRFATSFRRYSCATKSRLWWIDWRDWLRILVIYNISKLRSTSGKWGRSNELQHKINYLFQRNVSIETYAYCILYVYVCRYIETKINKMNKKCDEKLQTLLIANEFRCEYSFSLSTGVRLVIPTDEPKSARRGMEHGANHRACEPLAE